MFYLKTKRTWRTIRNKTTQESVLHRRFKRARVLREWARTVKSRKTQQAGSRVCVCVFVLRKYENKEFEKLVLLSRGSLGSKMDFSLELHTHIHKYAHIFCLIECVFIFHLPAKFSKSHTYLAQCPRRKTVNYAGVSWCRRRLPKLGQKAKQSTTRDKVGKRDIKREREWERRGGATGRLV